MANPDVDFPISRTFADYFDDRPPTPRAQKKMRGGQRVSDPEMCKKLENIQATQVLVLEILKKINIGLRRLQDDWQKIQQSKPQRGLP